MNDDAERFYEFRDEASRDARMLSDLAGRDLPHSATDSTGSIRVTRSDSGTLSFDIDDGWRSEYGPADLSRGVMEALAALSAAQSTVWAEGLQQSFDEPRRSTPSPPVDESVAAKLQAALDAEPDRGAALTRTLENVLSMLEDISANIDDTFGVADRRGEATFTSVSLVQNVTAQVTATGDLLSVSFSEQWLSRSSGAQISRELNDAIEQARASAGETGSVGPFDGTPLAKYQRFIDDPDSFVDFIRGKD